MGLDTREEPQMQVLRLSFTLKSSINLAYHHLSMIKGHMLDLHLTGKVIEIKVKTNDFILI